MRPALRAEKPDGLAGATPPYFLMFSPGRPRHPRPSYHYSGATAVWGPNSDYGGPREASRKAPARERGAERGPREARSSRGGVGPGPCLRSWRRAAVCRPSGCSCWGGRGRVNRRAPAFSRKPPPWYGAPIRMAGAVGVVVALALLALARASLSDETCVGRYARSLGRARSEHAP
jgi:hypothetical protein